MESHTERYDRQIRLWGYHGQNKCSDARVCLVNCNALGSEILKGLCLAGISGYTILDSHKLSPEDVGSMFVPRDSSIMRDRGDVVKDMLSNMNKEVIGQVCSLEKYLPQSSDGNPDTKGKLICEEFDFWKQFNIVIAVGFLTTHQVQNLSQICWSLKVPLILSKSIGFFGYLRIQFEEHVVIETHTDNNIPDFRLDKPFPDLLSYLELKDLDRSDDIKNVNRYPYVIIVYHYLKQWQRQNNFPSTRLPNDYLEKKSLRSFISQGLKSIKKTLKEKHSDSDLNQELLFENFQEAEKAINTCFGTSSYLNNNTNLLFKHPKLQDPWSTSRQSFWVIISAIKEFYLKQNDEPVLPVSGSIPDMISSSDEYLKLLAIYQKKSKEDIEEIFNNVQNIIPPGSYHGQYLFDETKLLCKNIRNIELCTSTPVTDEFDFGSMTLCEEFENDEFIAIAFAFKALDIFYTNYGRLPGVHLEQVETDISKLKECSRSILKSSSKLKNLDQCLYELCRCGGSELHTTSAFMGGCVTQEAIKLITNQYITVNETMIYNALTSSTQTLKLKNAFSQRV